jgi:hypothetical protein
MDDISPDFNQKQRLKRKTIEDFDPRIVEFVKLLARACAKRDYNRFIQEQNKPKGDEPC